MGPIVATSIEPFQAVPSLRALTDGHVLASDPVRRRLVRLDSALGHPEVILSATGAAANAFPARGGTLFAIGGDTTLVLDAAGASFIVLGPTGDVVRVISVPRASDASLLGNASYGTPAIDSARRLVYRSFQAPSGYNPRTFTMLWPDSGPIVSVSFDTRRADTLAHVKVPTPPRMVSTTDLDGTRRFTTFTPPIELSDDWAMLPNGTVAIIRWRDYHVDWVTPDHQRHASPKTAWNWTRLTDDDKARFIDSLKARNLRADSATTRANGMMAGPGMKLAWETMTSVASDVPDYPPPFIPRATRVDLDGRIWVLERGKFAEPSKGLVYDLIDGDGQIVDRVQAPPNAAVIGFGPGGVVYLSIAPSNALLANSIPPVIPPQMSTTPPPNPVKLAKAVLPKKN